MQKDIYSSRLIKIPAPQYFVLYNGLAEQTEKVDLRLSDAFEKKSEGYEWTAHVINVNAGHNKNILSSCQILEDYAQFVAKVRHNCNCGMVLTKAIDTAVDDCIRQGILESFLRKHKSEVAYMYIFEYNEELHNKTLREEGRSTLIISLIKQGVPRETIASAAGMSVEQIEKIVDQPPVQQRK
ncbi:MAG: hypothetical protein IJL80_00445 [Treponema sp.]|nr:hypothetical protein [Treponema sp.]